MLLTDSQFDKITRNIEKISAPWENLVAKENALKEIFDIMEGIDTWDQFSREVDLSQVQKISYLIEHCLKTLPARCTERQMLAPLQRLIRVHCNSKNINAVSNGETLLHEMTKAGDARAVKAALYMYQTKVNAKDQHGATALHYAARLGHTDIAAILSKFKANVDAEDNEGKTPLHVAIEAGQPKMIDVLIRLKANLEAVDNSDKSPLATAAAAGDLTTINLLTQKNVPVNIASEGNSPALCEAAFHGQMEAVKLLVEQKQAWVDSEKKKTLSPLHNAILGGHINVVWYFITAGANLGYKDVDGQTAFSLAKSEKNWAILDLLRDCRRIHHAEVIERYLPLLNSGKPFPGKTQKSQVSQALNALSKKISNRVIEESAGLKIKKDILESLDSSFLQTVHEERFAKKLESLHQQKAAKALETSRRIDPAPKVGPLTSSAHSSPLSLLFLKAETGQWPDSKTADNSRVSSSAEENLPPPNVFLTPTRPKKNGSKQGKSTTASSVQDNRDELTPNVFLMPTLPKINESKQGESKTASNIQDDRAELTPNAFLNSEFSQNEESKQPRHSSPPKLPHSSNIFVQFAQANSRKSGSKRQRDESEGNENEQKGDKRPKATIPSSQRPSVTPDIFSPRRNQRPSKKTPVRGGSKNTIR